MGDTRPPEAHKRKHIQGSGLRCTMCNCQLKVYKDITRIPPESEKHTYFLVMCDGCRRYGEGYTLEEAFERTKEIYQKTTYIDRIWNFVPNSNSGKLVDIINGVRAAARQNKNWQVADLLRDILTEAGIKVGDQKI